MSTSLARQLAALRTPASAPTAQDTAYSGPFLFAEANQDGCDYATLKENAAASLSKLIESDVVFARFIQFIQEDSLGESLESEVIEDLLFLISPFTLLKPAQWILQLLVTRHKVHYKYPELFFFCVLPFYEYEIYSKALLAIDTIPGGSEYPNWFPKFKLACAPTTKLSLFRHTAADRGFFKLLCDMMLRLTKETVKYPNLRLQRQTSLFVMTLLGALENRPEVEEEQVNYILQVTLNTIKSNNQELISMAQILLSYLLPRVSFKEKAVTKITKSLKKCINKSASPENLMLSMMIIRTQANLESSKARGLIVSLEAAVNLIINNALDDEDKLETVDSLLYTLGLLVEPLVPQPQDAFTGADDPNLNQILAFASEILKKVPVSSESCSLMGTVAYNLLRAINRTEVEDMIDKEAVGSCECSLEKILKTINKVHPVEYQRIMRDTEEVDLFFMAGDTVNNRPSDALVAAKRALLNNKLISFLMNNPVNVQALSGKGPAKMLAANSSDINKVLVVDTQFLVEQLEGNQLERLLLNLFVLRSPEYSLSAIIGHLCSEVFYEKISSILRLELLLLPFYYKHDLRAVVAETFFAKKSPLMASLSTIGGNPDKFKCALGKLQVHLSNANVASFLGDGAEIGEATGLFLIALSSRLETGEPLNVDKQLLVNLVAELAGNMSQKKEKQGTDSKPEGQEDLTKSPKTGKKDKNVKSGSEEVLAKSPKKGKKNKDSEPASKEDLTKSPKTDQKEKNTEAEVLTKSPKKSKKSKLVLCEEEKILDEVSKTGVFPVKILINILHRINIFSEFTFGLQLLEKLPKLQEKGANIFTKAVDKLTADSFASSQQLLRFYLQAAMVSGDLKARYFSLQRLGSLVNQPKMCALLTETGAENDLLVLLLTQVLTNNEKLKKAALGLIKVLAKETSEDHQLKPLLEFLSANRSELISGQENFATMLSKANLGEESIAILLKQIVNNQSSVDCFNVLVDLFKTLKSGDSIKIIAEFGTKLVKGGTGLNTAAMIVNSFNKRLVKNLGQDACMIFFLACIKCNQLVTVAGIQHKLSNLTLERCSSPKLWTGADPDLVSQLMTSLVQLSSESVNVKLIQLLCGLSLSVKMFRDQLNAVWGEKNLKSNVRGNNSGGDDDFGAELVRWGRTMFLLELLDSYLSNEVEDQGWEVLIQPVFAILRKLSDDEVLESSYKLNVLLTVLLKLFNVAPDKNIKNLDKKDLEPELLTHCIRRSSNPESRQMSLKVLARCALTIPDYVLQNSLTIFTFMGNHLLKMDSKHSYKIACESIDVIVPAMRSTCDNKAQLQKVSLEILNNFIHMEDDVPEHRYSEFVYRLIKALDAESYLSIAMVLCVKSTFKAKHRVNKTNIIHRRLAELVSRFSAFESVHGLVGVFVNIRSDGPQIRRIFGCQVDRKSDDKADEWDILRLGVLLMLNKVLPKMDQRVGKELNQGQEKFKELLQVLLESAVITLESFDSIPNTPSKLKQDILTQGETTLQLVLSLLPYQLYISLIGILLGSPNATLRRRAMEVVSAKLEEIKEDVSGDVSQLLPNLLDLAVKETIVGNQQIALLAIRQISRKMKDPTELRTALETLNPGFLADLSSPAVLGAAVLTMTELLLAAGVVGVPYVENVLTWMLGNLDKLETKDWEEKNLKVVYSSLLLGLQKVLERFGGFINPLLDQLIGVACRLNNHPIAGIRAKSLLKSISMNVSPHVLLPRAKGLLDTLWEEPEAVAKFAGLIGFATKKLDRGQLNAISRQYVDFFSLALEYRSRNHNQVEETEDEIISAFQSVILRMGLDDFKPVFHQILDQWKLGENPTLTTMFNFITKIASSLMNLFSFAVDVVITESTDVIKRTFDVIKGGDNDVMKKDSIENTLLTSILKCVTTTLTYNKVSELSVDQYTAFTSALLSIDQGDEELYDLVEDAIAALAEATEDDMWWQQLNFSVLMAMRSPNNSVRRRMVALIRRFVTSRRDTYLVVLPDAAPFIAELCDDDDQEVDKAAKELISHMETTFGQNLEDYFS